MPGPWKTSRELEPNKGSSRRDNKGTEGTHNPEKDFISILFDPRVTFDYEKIQRCNLSSALTAAWPSAPPPTECVIAKNSSYAAAPVRKSH